MGEGERIVGERGMWAGVARWALMGGRAREGPQLRLLLRLVNVLLEFGLSGHAARDCWIGWFRDGSDGATLLLQLLLRVGSVEKPETIVLWRHWFDRSLLPGNSGKPSNSPCRCGGRHDGAEDAISHKVVSPPLLLINKARSLYIYYYNIHINIKSK